MNRTIQLLVLLGLTLCFQTGFAQDDRYQLTKGQRFEGRKRSTLTGIVGEDETGYYVLSRKGFGHIFLDHLTTDLRIDNSREIELTMEKKDRDLEWILYLDGKLVLFSSLLDKDLQKNILFMETVDKTTLSPNGDITKLTEIDYDKRRNSGFFAYSISPDESKIMLYAALPYEKNAAEKFKIQVFDTKMKALWSENIQLPYTDDLFSLRSYTVDDEGDVVILGKLYKDKVRDERNGEANYKFLILSYSSEGDEPVEYEAKLEGRFLMDMKIAVDKTGNIICAGFYSDDKTMGIKGSYYISIDRESKEILKKGIKEFPLDFITQEMSAKQKRKAEKKAEKGKNVQLYNYDLNQLIIHDNGSAVLIAEYYRMYSTTNFSTVNGVNTSTTTYYYYYDNLLVISIDQNGEIEWATKIPKQQHTVNDAGRWSSYTMAAVNDNLYFVFNDDVRNMDPNLPAEKRKIFSADKRTATAIVEVSENGEQHKTQLYTAKEEKVLTRPKVCRQIGPSTILIYSEWGRNQQFNRLDIR